MNLTISPVNSVRSNVSFGMADFTKEGMRLAQSSSDVYEPLKTPTEFMNPKFFEKKGLFGSEFSKFVKENSNSADGIQEIKKTIEACGCSNNAYANSKFIKQLVSAKKLINKLPEEDKKDIAQAVVLVFNNNWNNQKVSKEDTMTLLEMSQSALQDNEYVTLTGVIDRSDEPDPQKESSKKTK